MRRCATTLEAEMSAEEHEFLMSLLRTEKFPGRHLEIGTAAGGTLCEMMDCFPATERPPFVVVDPMKYFPRQLDRVRENLHKHGLDPTAVDFRVAKSQEAFEAATAAGDEFDFILIDGCHKILSVTTDLHWTRLLKPGGIVCFHDYTRSHKGVFFAVNRFLATHPNYEPIGCHGTLLALRKTAPAKAPEVGLSNRLHAWLLYLPLQIERKVQQFQKRRAAA